MGASLGVFDGTEEESVHTLRPGGQRRGEEGKRYTADEGSPIHHSMTWSRP